MKRAGASITVFLSLAFICTVSLIYGLLESARTEGVRFYLQMAADSAMNSLMSNYHRGLWDGYRVILYENQSDEELINTYMHYVDAYVNNSGIYNLSAGEAHLNTGIFITDDGGRWLSKQICEYMKANPVDMINNRLNDDAKQIEKDAESAKDRRIDIDHPPEVTDDEEGEDSENSAEPGNKEAVIRLENILSLLSGNVSRLVIPAEHVLSEDSIDSEELPSQNITEHNYIADPIDKLLIDEYIRVFFSSYTDHSDKELSYEMEYIIGGHNLDKANLDDVILRILAIREGLNYLHILEDPQKRSSVDTAAATIAGLAKMPDLKTYIAGLIIAAWALAESVADVRTLLKGGKVPLYKTAEDWKIDMDSLFAIDEDTDMGMFDQDVGCGLDYEAYLGMFLVLMPDYLKLYRIMDLMQHNLRRKEDGFVMRKMLHAANISLKATSSRQFISYTGLESSYTVDVYTIGAY